MYGEVGHGPWCYGLPNPKVPSRTRRRSPRAPTSTRTRPPATCPRSSPAAPEPDAEPASSGYAGTDAEQAIVNALLAGETGRAADSYGALGSLLYGPVVRGGGDS